MALGGVVTSLQKKRVIAVTKGARPNAQTDIVDGLRIESIVGSELRTELWFDCEALEELLDECPPRAAVHPGEAQGPGGPIDWSPGL